MAQLHEDAAALRVDGIRDLPPARDVRVFADPGRTEVATAVVRHVGRFGDDQTAGGSALHVVLEHHVARTVVAVGAKARGRRMHHAVIQSVRAELKRREELGHGETLLSVE